MPLLQKNCLILTLLCEFFSMSEKKCVRERERERKRERERVPQRSVSSAKHCFNQLSENSGFGKRYYHFFPLLLSWCCFKRICCICECFIVNLPVNINCLVLRNKNLYFLFHLWTKWIFLQQVLCVQNFK